MSMLKRLSATLITRVDRVVEELEDHDAVVQAALSDMQRRVAETRVRCARVQREQEALTIQIADQRAKSAQWRSRAVACGADDRAMALECLARARSVDQDVERLAVRLERYRQNAEKLSGALAAMEERLDEMRQKQVLMRARESAGRAMTVAASSGQQGLVVDDVLDRWEVKVTELEMGADPLVAADPLDKRFAENESQTALEAELAALLNGEKNNGC